MMRIQKDKVFDVTDATSVHEMMVIENGNKMVRKERDKKRELRIVKGARAVEIQ